MIKKIKIRGYRTYRDFELIPNSKFNLVVGPNEAGKSTLIEALTLALTGRINGRSASEEFNPYWFNTSLVSEFIDAVRAGKRVPFPEIRIELFLDDRAELQKLCGAHNSDVPTYAGPGVSLHIKPNAEYQEELESWRREPSLLLPIEYYVIDWREFSDEQIVARPKVLATAVIDSNTLRSTSSIDYHLRQILEDSLTAGETAKISLAYRQVKETMSAEALRVVNESMSKVHADLHDRPITLAMDQSSRTSWKGAVTPHVSGLPFALAGQGQQAAIKISLAMNRSTSRANMVMIEEPENHLSHTTLSTLLGRLSKLAGTSQQLFISTHSSFVLNRLGLDQLVMLNNGKPCKFSGLSPSTVKYFQKLPGYDTLRLALADKVVLVEGPSDEIIFERVFKDIHKKSPMDCGIDVLSMRGLSIARGLEVCSALGKTVAALRDNDGTDPNELAITLEKWLKNGERQLFIGNVENGRTLEPQLLHFNGEAKLREVLGLNSNINVSAWMSREKTECALRIAESTDDILPPEYMKLAAQFIHG